MGRSFGVLNLSIGTSAATVGPVFTERCQQEAGSEQKDETQKTKEPLC
jgi:hypothetical protein